MPGLLFNKVNKTQQYIISILLISVVSVFCYFLSGYLGYRVVALVLLVTVSLISMFFGLWPVLLSAFLSALIWDFFFIPPTFKFTVDNTEDALMLMMYFIIAMVNAAMTFKIRQIEKTSRKKEEKEKEVVLYNTIINSLSHELRTPISTIIGATDNLMTEFNHLSEDNKNELITEISKASLRLDRQVENLLNMSRLESGFIKAKRDWCDMTELVNEVLNRLKENLDKRVINVQFKDDLPLFRVDHGLIEEVLYNLLLNATLYSSKYCVITLRVNGWDDKLILVVEDNGNGFPEDAIGKAFDKFYRVKNSEAGGTGLGLSIAKGFVEAHDGSIELDNLPDGGARFTIQIPAETSYINNLKNE
ncbi:MAG: ATP-binding protein [Bacteroidota bacterium]